MEKINNSVAAYFRIGSENATRANVSNPASVMLRTDKAICVNRNVMPSTFVAGSQVTFFVDITNTGSLWFSGVRVIENLSGIGYLTYVPGSAKLLYYGQWLAPEIADVNPLTFTLSPLSVGQTMTLKYTCTVNSNIPSDIKNLVSTLTAIGYTYNSVAKATENQLLSLSNSAYLTITKSATTQTAAAGMPFDYVVNLNNSNSNQIEIDRFVDNLPAGFVVTQVVVKIDGGMPVVLGSTDYSVDANNVLTILSSNYAITVPGASGGLSGSTVVTIKGHF